MIKRILLLAAFVAVSIATSTRIPTFPCSTFDESSFPISLATITLEGCDETMERCPLTRGRNQTLNCTFSVTEQLCGVKNQLHGKFKPQSSWKVPYIPQPSTVVTCDKETGDCLNTRDLIPGREYEYRFTFYCNKNFPRGVQVYVEHKLLDCTGNVVHCIMIPTQIDDPPANEVV